MDALEVSTAVSAVVSAFHSGAELVHLIRKRNRRSRGEQAYKEKALLDSLEAGETQVESQYAADCSELGEGMRKGDAISRDRLLHIAVTMQSEIIRSLQIAARNELAVLDMTALHETSVMNRRDTLNILADLRQRLALDFPIEGPTRTPNRARTSLESARRRVSGTLSDFTPSAVTIPEETESRTRLGRIFSNRRASVMSHRASTRIMPSSSQAPVLANMPWISNLQCEEEDTIAPLPQELPAEVPPRLRPPLDLQPPAYSSPSSPRDYPQEKASSYFPNDPRPVHPLEREAQMQNQADSRRNSDIPAPEHFPTDAELQTAIIGYLDNLRLEKEAGCRDSMASRTTSLSTGSRYSESDFSHPGQAGPYLSIAPPGARHSYSSVANSSPYSYNAPSNELNQGSQTPHVHFARHRPSPSDSTYGSMPSDTPTGPNAHPNPFHHRPRPSISTNCSSAPSASASPFPPPTPQPQSRPMLGRPCKSNNYWGFCKGSWTLREDSKKGLALRQKPVGMYTSALVFQCRECAFEGKSFGAKKPYVPDPNIHAAGPDAGGIRYRWMFLAKSHVKQKHRPLGGGGGGGGGGDVGAGFAYGCLFCSGEGRQTGVFGDVETLMRHVYAEHAAVPGGLGEGLRAKTRCVVGRVAGAEEDWDVNVPFEPGLQQQKHHGQQQQQSRWSEDSGLA